MTCHSSLFVAFRRKSAPVSGPICNGIFDSLGHLDSELESALSESCLNLGMIMSSRRSTSLIHHANADSSEILLVTAYSAPFTGLDSFRSVSGPSIVELYFRVTNSFRILVVRRLDLFDLCFSKYLSSLVTADASFLCSEIFCMVKYSPRHSSPICELNG